MRLLKFSLVAAIGFAVVFAARAQTWIQAKALLKDQIAVRGRM